MKNKYFFENFVILFEHQNYSKALQTISFGTKSAKNQPDLLLQFLQLEADTYSVLHSSSEILSKSETENYSSKTEKIHMQIIKTCDKLIETENDIGLSTGRTFKSEMKQSVK